VFCTKRCETPTQFVRQAVPLCHYRCTFSTIKQTGILNGYGGLIRKTLQPFRMCLSKIARGRAVQRKKAKDLAI
jgi:hypothetical protein